MRLLLSLLTSLNLRRPQVPVLMLDIYEIATVTVMLQLQVLLKQISETADAADRVTSSCNCISSQQQT